MSVVVLGANGRVGRLLRPVWPEGCAAVWQSRSSQAGYSRCDILEEPYLLEQLLQGASALLCLAGSAQARTKVALRDHSRLAQASIAAAARAGVTRVLLASSAAVYGRAPSSVYEETVGLDVSEYGLAKLEMEEAALALGQAQGVEVSCLRIGNVAGADAILGAWQPGFSLDVFDNGTTPERSYIGPESLAKVVVALACAERVDPVVNVAAPRATAMGDLLNAAELPWQPRRAGPNAIASVSLATGKLARYCALPERAADPAVLVAEWRRASEPAGRIA